MQLYSNNARSTLVASILSTATSLEVVTGDAPKYPAPGPGDFFDLTLQDATNIEIVRITARVGGVMTIGTRALEGTTANAFAVGTVAGLRLTAAVTSTAINHTGLATGAHAASAISSTPSGNLAATEVQAALNELQTDVDTRATSAALSAHAAAADPHPGYTTTAELDAGLVTKQGLDATLTALAGLATGADQLPYSTGADAFAQTPFAPFARTLLDDANQASALTTLGAPLNAAVTLTAAYTVVAADRGKLFDCSGTFAITLTAAATLGAGFTFAVRNSGTGVITLDPNAAELVDGAATITYAAGVSSLVTCNGTAFKTVGYAAPPADGSITAPKLSGAQSGTAPIYAARAWVNFNGADGGIRAAGNVASVTRNGVGYYTINFSTAMPDANYSVFVSGNRGIDIPGGEALPATGFSSLSTTSVVVGSQDNNSDTYNDTRTMCVSIFR